MSGLEVSSISALDASQRPLSYGFLLCAALFLWHLHIGNGLLLDDMLLKRRGGHEAKGIHVIVAQ